MNGLVLVTYKDLSLEIGIKAFGFTDSGFLSWTGDDSGLTPTGPLTAKTLFNNALLEHTYPPGFFTEHLDLNDSKESKIDFPISALTFRDIELD